MAKKVWNYDTDGGMVYPVQVGDVWQAGSHLIMCNDLETQAPEEFLRMIGHVDLVYMDPPWNAGNAAHFRTKANVPRKVNFELFLLRILDLIKQSGAREFYMEMGNATVDLLEALVRGNSGIVHDQWDITYYRKKPCKLIHATFGDAPRRESSANGLDDEHTPLWALQRSGKAGDVVLDLCHGRGGTSFAAARLGMIGRGFELHPNRTSSALCKLASLGHEPKLLTRVAE